MSLLQQYQVQAEIFGSTTVFVYLKDRIELETFRMHALDNILHVRATERYKERVNGALTVNKNYVRQKEASGGSNEVTNRLPGYS